MYSSLTNLSINYRKNKINLFANYSYSFDARDQLSTLARKENFDGELLETFLSKDRRPTRKNQNGRIGMSYQIDDKTSVGLNLSGYINLWDMDESSLIFFRPQNRIDTIINSENSEESDWKHLQSNIYFSRKIKNGTLNFDADYLVYDNVNPIDYDQQFSLGDGTALPDQNLQSRKLSPFSIWVSNVDYTHQFGERTKWSSGLKGVLSSFENDVAALLNESLLPQFSDRSVLEEKILAAYTQFEYPLSDKTTVKAGLRYEYTDSELTSDKDGVVVDRQFGTFFPSIYVQHQLNDVQQFNFSYSRRINRPSFSDMASFVIFLDPRTVIGGNAGLQPAISNTFQFDYNLKTVNFSLQYTMEDSTIVRFQNRFDPVRNITTIIPDNLQQQQLFTASVALPITINKWWKTRWYGQYIYTIATTVEEALTYKTKQGNFLLNGSLRFKLPADLELEISGFYQTGVINGNQTFEPFGVLNAGLQKKFTNGSRLSLNFTDILNSLEFRSRTNIPAEQFFINRLFDFSQRSITLSYSMRFGSEKIKAAKVRKSAGDELKERVN